MASRTDAFLAEANKLRAAVIQPGTRAVDVYTISPTKLGAGVFGSVYPGVRAVDGRKVACKYIPSKLYSTPAQQYEALREPYILRCVAAAKSPHIVEFISAHEEVSAAGAARLVVVTEKAEGGELFDRIAQISHYTERDAARVSYALFSAIRASHSCGVLHRDLKPENVLLRARPGEPGDDDIVVADFGLSMFATEQVAPGSSPVGTYAYMAPEILTSRRYSAASDVWALGVLLYIFCAGFPPFWAGEANDTKGMVELICKGAYEFYPDVFDAISGEAKDLISRMMTVDPARRISLKDAMLHPWFAKCGAVPPAAATAPAADAAPAAAAAASAPAAAASSAASFSAAAAAAVPEAVHLAKTQAKLRAFNSKRKFRAAAVAVLFGAAGMRAAYHELAGALGAHSFTHAQVAELTSAFARAAGAGAAVDFPSFCRVMGEVGLGLDQGVMSRMFLAFDKDFSGSIDCRELLAGLAALAKGDAASLHLLFNVFDADGSGFISKGELAHLLASTGYGAAQGVLHRGAAAGGAEGALAVGAAGAELACPDRSIALAESSAQAGVLERVFAAMDANKDGKVSFEEFRAALSADAELAQALLHPMRTVAAAGGAGGGGGAGAI